MRRAEFQPETLATTPIFVTHGPLLMRLRFWTEEQWDALPEHERPAEAVYAKGRGWVGVVPTAILN